MYNLTIYTSSERELKGALNAVQVYFDTIGMSLRLDKCAVLHFNRGRGVGEDVDFQLEELSCVTQNPKRRLNFWRSYYLYQLFDYTSP